MNDALIALGALSVVYVISGIFLLLRSNTAVISARSTSLIYAFHLGNWLESGFMVLIIFKAEFGLDTYEETYWLSHVGAGISHFLVYLPYVLRAYRIYLIFVLECGIDDFSDMPLYYRTTQRWLVQALAFALAAVLLVYGVFTVFMVTGVVRRFYDVDSGFTSESPFIWILIFVRFLEHLLLILAAYIVRNVEDDFSMLTELIIVTIFYFLTPLSTLFHYKHEEYLWLFIVRNLLLLLISSIYPVFLSYTKSCEYQMLSVENLYSLELLLLHPLGVTAFESYLKSFNPTSIQETRSQGPEQFELLMLINCWLFSNNPKFFDQFFKFQDLLQFDNSFDLENSSEFLQKQKDSILSSLEKTYFNGFTRSQFMRDLRKIVFRHEMLQLRLMQTSMIKKGEKLKIEYFYDVELDV